jgi:translation initiation factor IF-3
LIDENGKLIGSVSFEDARKKAKSENKDLVLVNAKSNTYRIADAGKLKYEQRQKEKQANAQKRTNKVKEVKFRPLIDRHDFDIKLNHIREFLNKGLRTKIIMTLRGREKAYKDQAIAKFNEIPNTLINEGLAVLDAPAKFDGNNFVALLSPVQK